MVDANHVAPFADVAMPPLGRPRFHGEPAERTEDNTERAVFRRLPTSPMRIEIPPTAAWRMTFGNMLSGRHILHTRHSSTAPYVSHVWILPPAGTRIRGPPLRQDSHRAQRSHRQCRVTCPPWKAGTARSCSLLSASINSLVFARNSSRLEAGSNKAPF